MQELRYTFYIVTFLNKSVLIKQFFKFRNFTVYMKTVCVVGSCESIFRKAYGDFSKRCLEGKLPLIELKNNFIEVQDLFVKSGQAQEFYDKTLSFSKDIELNGNKELYTLLLNELSKFCMKFKLRQTPEMILQKVIHTFQRNNDSMHELARLTDLEQIYQYSGDSYNLFRTLSQKKDCCKRILADYDKSAKHFISLRKEPTPRVSVQSQLAYTYANMATMLKHKNPKDALAMLKKSIEIFQRLNNEKAVTYALRQINSIKHFNKKLCD